MRYLLSKTSLPVLQRLAHERTLCAFDFDGTLAPIVACPNRAKMRASTRKLLERAAALYPSIVVSGRSREDVLKKLSGIPLAGVFGNHGAEAAGMKRQDPRVKQWEAALKSELANLPGVWIEDKGSSLAVHFRQSAQPAQSRRRISAAVSKLNAVRAFGGKKVINLVANGAPTKGDAVAAERDRLRCNWILYVGDDQNDEDAFALQCDIVAIRIGKKRHTQARFYLKSQAEIDQLLSRLIDLRTAESAESVRSGFAAQKLLRRRDTSNS